MCGHVGILGRPSKRNRLVFEDMLHMDFKRGPHSTGIAAANNQGAVILKKEVLPWDLLKEEAYTEIRTKDYPLLMGHNRWATLGPVNDDNAHPFQHKHIILTHNGTLKNNWALQRAAETDFDTDSEQICYDIAEHGIDETYPKLDGAVTIVWWDQLRKTLNVISNGERPFFWGWIKGDKGLVYASEEWIISAACAYRGIELQKPIRYPIKHMHYEFSLNRKGRVSLREGRELKNFIKPVVIPMTPHLGGTTGKVGFQNMKGKVDNSTKKPVVINTMSEVVFR